LRHSSAFAAFGGVLWPLRAILIAVSFPFFTALSLPGAASFQSQDKPAPSRKLKVRPQQCRQGLLPPRF
jgi:hypothetical protein